MAEPKLLIADYNEDFYQALASVLSGRYSIRCCRGGKEALALLRQEAFDYLVLDVMLPEIDGITLLEQITTEGVCPRTLLLTPLLLDHILESAGRLGVGYIMRKPCEIQAVAARIQGLTRPLHHPAPKATPESILTEWLMELSFHPNKKGYPCVVESILQLAQNLDQAVTKEIYPVVAKRLGRTADNVERSSRTAINAAWKQGDPQIWAKYFPGCSKAPTNAKFLARMAQALRVALE